MQPRDYGLHRACPSVVVSSVAWLLCEARYLPIQSTRHKWNAHRDGSFGLEAVNEV